MYTVSGKHNLLCSVKMFFWVGHPGWVQIKGGDP